MPFSIRMVGAVLRRNFNASFLNPTGYVFITVFILLGAMAAFWRPAFFLNNLATLDQLVDLFPLLMVFFAPALAMNTWSEERRLGTDELLFTLPGRDVDVVLGKFLAVVGIHTVAIVFSLSHVLILLWLGRPDLGLLAANYVGFWLLGVAMLSVAMVASQLTSNATVAFILGALMCGTLVFVHRAADVIGPVGSWIAHLGVTPWFAPFGEGLVPIDSVLAFAGLTVVMLFLNVGLVGRRHVTGGQRSRPEALHLAARSVALAVISVSVVVIAGRAGAATDATAERLHTLQSPTRSIIAAVPRDRPVLIQAFVSPEVPEPYVTLRRTLLNLLGRFDEIGGPAIDVVVRDTEPFTEFAREAQENFGIAARTVAEASGSRRGSRDIFLGLVFTSGPDEVVIPFLEPGLPVEYELARSVRVVSRADRRRIGVVATAAGVMGGFDFQSMTSRPSWSFVEELRKQYEVEEVPAEGPYPSDLDAIVAILPSSLTQPGMDALSAAIASGTPTLVLDDPLSAFNPQLSAQLPADSGRNPFTSQGQPPAPAKGDLDGLLRRFGVKVETDAVRWSAVNPYPAFADTEPEIVFLKAAPGDDPFAASSPISAGLQEMVMLYPAAVVETVGGASDLEFTPLIVLDPPGGTTAFETLLQSSFFGLQLAPNPPRVLREGAVALAARARGTIPGAAAADDAEAGAGAPFDLIVVGDVDAFSETFFQLRRQGIEGLNFDNVTFALNCIDALVGDDSFVDLRKHRAQHRSLTRIESVTEAFTLAQRERRDEAEARADEQLQEAQGRLDQRVNAIRGRDDMDDQTRAIMERNVQEVERRRLAVVEAEIQREREQAIALARTDMETRIAATQTGIRVWAAALPPIPTLLLALGTFIRRRSREATGVPPGRRVGAPINGPAQEGNR
ncbi:MAG: Gldg family protein [Phycisphaerales bacterium]